MPDRGDSYEAQRKYEGFELHREDYQSLDEIEKRITRGYEDQDSVRAHINYLERLTKRVEDALRNEQSFGYSNDTLIHDHGRIKTVMKRLDEELDRLDR